MASVKRKHPNSHLDITLGGFSGSVLQQKGYFIKISPLICAGLHQYSKDLCRK